MLADSYCVLHDFEGNNRNRVTVKSPSWFTKPRGRLFALSYFWCFLRHASRSARVLNPFHPSDAFGLETPELEAWVVLKVEPTCRMKYFSPSFAIVRYSPSSLFIAIATASYLDMHQGALWNILLVNPSFSVFFRTSAVCFHHSHIQRYFASKKCLDSWPHLDIPYELLYPKRPVPLLHLPSYSNIHSTQPLPFGKYIQGYLAWFPVPENFSLLRNCYSCGS